MSEWQTSTLRSLCSEVVDCPHSTPKWTESGVLVLRSQNIRLGKLDLSKKSYTDEATYELRSRRARLQAEDLVITREAPMGEVCIVPANLKCCLGQRMVLLRPDRQLCQPKFLLYVIQSSEVQHQILMNEGTGSTVSNLRIPVLESLQIPCPPLHEQKAIAHILGTLDDKIDQLRKTNSVLEDMASALFKSWFVDFDPVKAKQENIPTGLPKDLDELFPDSFEDSALGPIPKGWRVAGLASTGEFLNGLALQKYPGDVLPVIKIPQLRQNSTEGADKCSDGIAPQYVIDDGDLLFSWSGTLVAGWWTAGKGALNQHLFKVSSGELSLVMLKHWIDHHLPWFRLVASSKAVTMGHIKRSHLDEAKVVIPAMALNDHAQTILADYRDKFIANGKHIRTLTNLRDTLLPKLISGDLRVPEAEQMVAELGL